MPALPLDEAGQYVAAAYLVFVVLLIVYVAIMAVRMEHISRQVESLAELAERRERERKAGDQLESGGSASSEAEPGSEEASA
jgi:Tfp pilus assembly protein PilO